jgi:starvation-inducible outer membrane lipoprotein
MNCLPFRPVALAWLTAPALTASLLLSACNSQPTATETDKTATVVETPNMPPVTADSTAAGNRGLPRP